MLTVLVKKKCFDVRINSISIIVLKVLTLNEKGLWLKTVNWTEGEAGVIGTVYTNDEGTSPENLGRETAEIMVKKLALEILTEKLADEMLNEQNKNK